MRAFVFIVIKEDVVTFYKAREEKKTQNVKARWSSFASFFKKAPLKIV